MEDILSVLREFGPYIGLPLIIHFIVNGLKTQIPFFKTITGIRFIHFLPVILGVLGGLLLPEDTWKGKVLTGGGLGCLSLFIYKIITVTFARKANLEDKIIEKDLDD